MNAQLEPLTDNALNLVPLSERDPGDVTLVPAEEWNGPADGGLLLSVDVEPESRFASADVIAIEFPAFNDGRGLSLAVLLRTRFGFTGELRAVGHLNLDILHYLARCGFDNAVLDDVSVVEAGRHHRTQANLLAPYSDNYQASVVEPEPAYRRVRRGA